MDGAISTGIRSTCPYCGVGCGVVAQPDGRIVGDTTHPANFGRLCSKGAALAETLGDAGRLHFPTIDGERTSWDDALGAIADNFRATIAEHGPGSVAFYVSGQCLTEDYYVANKLMKGFLGSANIDTNSRLCMSSTVAGHVRAFGADVVPGIYEDFEEADLIILVGSNLAWCHPVLFQRMQAARAERGTKLVIIDPRRTATSEGADLQLSLAPGSDVALFAGLLEHLRSVGAFDHEWIDKHTAGITPALEAARSVDVAGLTGLDPADIATFYEWFAATPRTVTLFSQGVNQSSAGSDKVNSIINVHLATGRIGKPGAGPFSITGQPNAMGGREVGGLSNQIAAHMLFNHPGAAERVQRFWKAPTLLAGPGLKAVDLFDAVHDGTVRAIWIMCTNPADSMPRADRVRAALRDCPFVVVSDAWATDTTALAKIVLPAAAWGEREGTVTNSERRITRQRAFRDPPGEARPDWWAMAKVAGLLGWRDAFAWPNAAAVFREHADLTAFENDGTRPLDLSGLSDISDEEYDAMPPVQWPVTRDRIGGRLFTEGGFATPDGRARFVPTAWRPIANLPTVDFPLLLNTGRVRDQWHTMTRTGLVPKLLQHVAEPTAAFHPDDAADLGLTDRGLVRLTTKDAVVTMRCVIDVGQRRGDVFIPMHWTDAFAAAGPVARLVSAAVDPVSGQPELKATPVRAQAVATTWRGLMLHTAPMMPRCAVWSRVPLEAGHGFDLADDTALPADLAAFGRSLMQVGEAEILELSDPGRGTWRFAAVRDGRLQACLYLTTRADGLPTSQALAALLTKVVENSGRTSLLAGGASGAPRETQVCACFSVGADKLRNAIVSQNLTTVAEIGEALQAGTNCGSCIPELKKLLREQALTTA